MVRFEMSGWLPLIDTTTRTAVIDAQRISYIIRSPNHRYAFKRSKHSPNDSWRMYKRRELRSYDRHKKDNMTIVQEACINTWEWSKNILTNDTKDPFCFLRTTDQAYIFGNIKILIFEKILISQYFSFLICTRIFDPAPTSYGVLIRQWESCTREFNRVIPMVKFIRYLENLMSDSTYTAANHMVPTSTLQRIRPRYVEKSFWPWSHGGFEKRVWYRRWGFQNGFEDYILHSVDIFLLLNLLFVLVLLRAATLVLLGKPQSNQKSFWILIFYLEDFDYFVLYSKIPLNTDKPIRTGCFC